MKKQSCDKSKPPANLLPEPMELAKLAALLAPTSEPSAALKQAAQLYIEAVFFMRKVSGFEALVHSFGNQERRLKLMLEPMLEPMENTFLEPLLLAPTMPSSDPARSFLAKHGLRLKDAKAVLAHLQRLLESQL